ncbi:MAG: DUF58 domain-containing protein [Proteobacteria bacterium]|nr:DUF58 domain-containing protein [Pseudomonadota bacterium]MBU1710278.1 DUF58 domain-containing protein [Pseudomonadota bacterium]
MISKELAKKIRKIQIYTSKAVNDVLAGEYESVFKGRGMQFDEVREYQPGDEIRTIDWNVTARTGHPYVKQYVEERELTVVFLVDLSASGSFGSSEKTKNEIAAEFCALLAFSAIKNNDKVGLIAFTDRIELFIPPKKGVSHVLRLIRELLCFTPQGTRTDIGSALDYLGRVIHKRGVVFLVSDFIAPDFKKPLRVLSKRHDLIAVSVSDPREIILPDVGLIELEDAETGQLVLIDTGSQKIRENYSRLARERQESIRENFRANSVDHIKLLTDHDYLLDLIHFFKRRERRRH